MREATWWCGRRSDGPRRFNPRLPCGRRLRLRILVYTNDIVSIHASHAGGDWRIVVAFAPVKMFQSTPPMREATTVEPVKMNWLKVSIHASHAGGDSHGRKFPIAGGCFNPRLPCGRRLAINSKPPPTTVFQSTPPMREATIAELLRFRQ